MYKYKEDFIKFLVWMRNGTAFCTIWFLILMLVYNSIYNISLQHFFIKAYKVKIYYHISFTICNILRNKKALSSKESAFIFII